MHEVEKMLNQKKIFEGIKCFLGLIAFPDLNRTLKMRTAKQVKDLSFITH